MSGFTPSVSKLPAGRGLRLQQGPIDLVVHCEGDAEAVRTAYACAQQTFIPVLQVLVDELPVLRSELPLHAVNSDALVNGPVATRMLRACLPFSRHRVSLMAAVAGSVADHMLGSVTAVTGIDKAWVNNGGDIAVHVVKGQVFDCGILPDVLSNAMKATFRIGSGDGTGGIATSGRATHGQGGRSFSLGIADSVTVLAANAATADVAATLVANAVDLPAGHPAVHREPAVNLDCDSDLVERQVVTGVASLSVGEIHRALDEGFALAQHFRDKGFIQNAVLTLRDEVRVLNSGTAVSAITNTPTQSARLAGERA